MEDLYNEILAENLGATYKPIILNSRAASAPVTIATPGKNCNHRLQK